MSHNLSINPIPFPKDVKGLIFDLDGTLAHTMPLHYRAWQKVSRERGFVFEEELFYLWAGIPTLEVIGKINELHGYQLDPITIQKDKERCFLELMDEIGPIGPAVAVVKEQYGLLPMAIGTGSKREFALKTLNILGLAPYFEAVVCADDVQNHKPHPETFLLCAKLINIPPEDCVVFEDG
ncbi:MAG: phosphatase, partial [Spirochaetae bacterium HGW-Spirochaetae-6]